MSALSDALARQQAKKLAETVSNTVPSLGKNPPLVVNTKPNPLDKLFPKKEKTNDIVAEVKPRENPVPEQPKSEVKTSLPSFLIGAGRGASQPSKQIVNGTGPIKGTGVATTTPELPKENVQIKPKVDLTIVIPENIPDEQRINVEELKKNIDFLVDHIEDKDLIRDVVRNILVKVNKNPDLAVFVPSELINVVVRGAKASYKYEQFKASETKEKGRKKSAKMEGLEKMFKDLGDIKFD